MTPISPNELAKIAERLRENERKLEWCPLHDFEMRYPYGDDQPPRWVCRTCGGIIDEATHRWYDKGAKDQSQRIARSFVQNGNGPPHNED